MSEYKNEQREAPRPEAAGDMLEAGVLLAGGQYRIEKFLNSGGFGMTYLARNSLDRIVVIKECFPSFLCHRKHGRVEVRSTGHLGEYRGLVDLFRAEARALARLQHPNIVGVHEVFDDNNTAYMALDFVEGKDLHEIVETEPERLGPVLLRELLTNVLGAVSYIHEQGVLHRDISPDNILIDRHNTPVLIDFGSARDSGRKSNLSTRLQSVKDGYSPHEFYARDLEHSASSDLYALGATFYFAITGEAPAPSQYRLAQMIERRVDPYVPLKGKHDRYDARLLETIDQSLSVVAAQRIQSARSWLLVIDDQSRQLAALEKARLDSRIEALVRELVIETNRALECQAAEDACLKQKAEEQKQEIEAKKHKNPGNRIRAEWDVPDAVETLAASIPQDDIEPALTDDLFNLLEHKFLEVRAVRKLPATQVRPGRGNPEQEPGLEAENGYARPITASLPVVVRSSKRVAQAPQTDEPEMSRGQKRRPRRGFSINWNLPPLYVSHAVQLAGDFDR
ncbi:serine/threonine protein kinase [Aliiruegeria lutimaris]|uniref:Serine/threonine protein kinase n=1 Tax=Aliiruegeria lutimaris TaxID=571298 RepID=A0A1G8VGG9_9RHOB|nr:serine/threonine-protein kinase [Aliiruegeria lutimaris]SDJ64415.1 Serine/threonine protein kinase [Aliiruegeria lutimaris]